jgi:hypothetical protein
MAKKSMIEREKKREALVKKYAAKRAALKEIVSDESKPMEERFRASLKLAKLPRNSAGPWLFGPNPRHGQVELVRSASDERSYRRYADTHP